MGGIPILKNRNRKAFIIKCLQNLLLFAIAALLVTGFYYHGEFYQLGWFGLLIIGSIVTFIVLKAIIWLTYKKQFKDDYEGILIFNGEDVEAVKHGSIRQIIRPERKSNIKAGAVYRAKLNIMSDSYFSELVIKKIISKELKELSQKDIFLTGKNSFSEFKKNWVSKYGNWDPELEVKLIRFEPLAHN